MDGNTILVGAKVDAYVGKGGWDLTRDELLKNENYLWRFN